MRHTPCDDCPAAAEHRYYGSQPTLMSWWGLTDEAMRLKPGRLREIATAAREAVGRRIGLPMVQPTERVDEVRAEMIPHLVCALYGRDGCSHAAA